MRLEASRLPPLALNEIALFFHSDWLRENKQGMQIRVDIAIVFDSQETFGSKYRRTDFASALPATTSNLFVSCGSDCRLQS